MADVTNQGMELSGWKQIAGYLRVSVRTAQTLEKEQGLPVRRGASPKAPVFALPVELDEWRRRSESPANASGLPVLSPKSGGRRQWLEYAVGGAGTAVIGAILGYGLPRIHSGHNLVPARYKVEGATLIVLCDDGTELWRHTFSREMYEATYTETRSPGVEYCVFTDLDSDGKVETLFRQNPKSQDGEKPLTCFDFNGKVRWEFAPSRTVVDNLGRSFAPPFWTNNFSVLTSGSSQTSRVVVSSHHNWSFPTQVAVIDGRTGRVLSEYWHRGQLLRMARADLDGTGEAEVLFGGVNDAPEYKQATLVIFDPRNISGASKNPKGGVYFQGMTAGTEKKVIFFPRTAISKHSEFNRVSIVRIAAGRITVNVAEGTDDRMPDVVYELDYQLRPINVALSNPLREQYRLLQASGKLPMESVDAITERLKSGIVVI